MSDPAKLDKMYKSECKYCGNPDMQCTDPRVIINCMMYIESQNQLPKKGKPAEQVNHPAHYGGDTTYETVKVLGAWLTPEEFEGALVFNAVKYLSRWRKKGGKQDVEKAQWYVNKLLEKMK